MSSFALRAVSPFSSSTQNFPRVADAARQQVSTPQSGDATTVEIARQLAIQPVTIESETAVAAHSDIMSALTEILSAAQALAEHVGEVMMNAVAPPVVAGDKPEKIPAPPAFSFATPPSTKLKALQTYEFTALLAAFKIESPALNISLEELLKISPPPLSTGLSIAPAPGAFALGTFAPSAFEVAPAPSTSRVTNFLALLMEQASLNAEDLTPNALDFSVSA